MAAGFVGLLYPPLPWGDGRPEMRGATRTLFDGDVHVHYSQLYVESREGEFGAGLSETFSGQRNGLCGGGCPGYLFMTTGRHTGTVGFAVELHDERPPADESWEEIVELSFTPTSSRVTLMQWAGEAHWPLDLPAGDYRVRYCATGMDEARMADTRLDRYLLQFWPGAAEPDVVVKRTSAIADYWHRFARELPPPPSPAELAAREREEMLAAQREQARLRALTERRRWGGRLPSDALRRVLTAPVGIAALDRDLTEAIAEAGPETQRKVARWAAHRAYALAGLTKVTWITPALEALDTGTELPPPFDDFQHVWPHVFGDDQVPRTTVTSLRGGPRTVSQQAMAVPALFAATGTDPLRAALDALYAAAVTFGDEYPVLMAETREAFPVLTVAEVS